MRLGVFVGENGKWGFFRELYADFQAHYTTSVFAPKPVNTPVLRGRLSRRAHGNAMRSMLANNDACFFEWASELLVEASQLPKRAKIITRMHSYEVVFWAPKINWDNVDRVILVSNAMHRRFCELYPKHAHKAVVVYNGVDLNRFKPPAQRTFQFNIGMVASIHPVKRIYEMVLTTYSLKQRGYNPHLHVAGGKWEGGYFDDYYGAVVGAIERLGLAQNVTLHDHVSDTPRWLEQIDIFASNSYWEGQQVALLEGIAAGCYGLSHFWEGAEEIVPPECIFITEEDLQAKLIEYAELPERARAAWQQRMRSIACEKFALDYQKQEMRRVIDETLGAR
jgi:glycosyltransferase involved in cell wall biosynthesis